MLAGFHAMDEHFRTAPLERNLPVLLGLLAVWYATSSAPRRVAVLPYDQYLKRFPAYLQQLAMESNGKSVTLDGARVDYDTGPIFWGEPGTNGQHSFYQLIHQGTRLIPADFIGFLQTAEPARRPPRPADGELLRPDRGAGVRQDRRRGPGGGDARVAGAAPHVRGQPPHEHDPGGAADPATLGRLVALYEHSVFTQGVVWGIDSFDQWGVELGKVLATRVAAELTPTTSPTRAHDRSTNALIARYRARSGRADRRRITGSGRPPAKIGAPDHGTRSHRPRPDGRQHRAAPGARRPYDGRLRPPTGDRRGTDGSGMRGASSLADLVAPCRGRAPSG